MTLRTEGARQRLEEAWALVDIQEVEASAKKASEERPAPPVRNGPDQSELAAREVEALVARVCANCMQRPEGAKLVKCSACMAVSYCGRDCQREAWPHHKRLCVVPKSTEGMSEERKEATKRAMRLFKASIAGDVGHMKDLLERRRISLAEWSSTGQTALHHAVVVGHVEMVTWLLESRQVNPFALNSDGDTAVKTAIQQHVNLRQRSLPALRALLQWRRSYLAGDPAASTDFQRGVEGLLDIPGAQDGISPLFIALQNRFIEAAYLLLAHGASPAMRNRDGTLPIYIAASEGYMEELRMLVAADGSPQHVNAPDTTADRITPVMMAAIGHQVDAVEWLLKQPGVRPDAVSRSERQNIYHIAANNGHLPLMSLLLGGGRGPGGELRPPAAPLSLAKAGDSDGDQAVHTVCYFGHLECLKLLVERLGPESVFARNGKGQTAYEVAVLQDQQHMAAWLRAEVPGNHTRPGAIVMWGGSGAMAGKAAHIDLVHETRLREKQQQERRPTT